MNNNSVIKGDIVKLALEGKLQLICHGCNCFNNMGAGLARQIAKTFPEALAVDVATIAGDSNKLGDLTFTKVKRNNNTIVIINAYTQYHYGLNRMNCDYNAIKSCFDTIAEYFGDTYIISYPRIGAGLAGGDWNVIQPIINESLRNCEHILIEY